MCIATMKISLRALFVPLLLLASAFSQEQTGNAKAVGTVQSISGNTAALKPDAGVEIAFRIEDATRVLRSEPGQKSLKEATPIQFSEIQTGDRTLASGVASPDGKSITASTTVV